MKLINRIHNSLNYRFWNFIKYHFPYFWAKYRYKLEIGRPLNLSCPRDINEKIIWLEFYTNTELWSLLADKYQVRNYVRQCIGEEYLIPLLGEWDDAADIDFESLPEKFVIKPNNGSYDTIIVQSKSEIDENGIRDKLKKSLSIKFGYDNAEIHYLRINPKIIAEKLLETDDEFGLNDYKIWCFNGEPYCVFVCIGRDPVTHHAEFTCYDLDWNWQPEMMHPNFRGKSQCPKPDNLPLMLEIASKLSKGLPQCRVDLYNVRGRIYFGELTLTSNYGMMPYFTQDTLEEMGQLCRLPRVSLKETVSCFCGRYLPKF